MTSSSNNIFNDVATLSEAGIPTLDAATRVALSHPELEQWPKVITKISKGHSLASALTDTNLTNDFEQQVIEVAENAGRLPQGLRRIALSYDKRRQRVSRLKSKLYLPVAMVFIAIIVTAIVTLTRNPEASIMGVIIVLMIKIILVLLFAKWLLGLFRKDGAWILKVADHFKNTTLYRHLYEQIVFGALLWNLQSGIEFNQAFAKVSRLLKSKGNKAQLMKVSRLCGSGTSMSESVVQADLPITADFKQVLITSEASGRWEDAIDNYLEHQQIMLDIQIESIFEWAPRIYYSVVVMIAISVIL